MAPIHDPTKHRPQIASDLCCITWLYYPPHPANLLCDHPSLTDTTGYYTLNNLRQDPFLQSIEYHRRRVEGLEAVIECPVDVFRNGRSSQDYDNQLIWLTNGLLLGAWVNIFFTTPH